MSPIGLTLGPPGVYHARAPEEPAFTAVRLDVAGFVGVAPRGPVDQPVPVETWSDYQWRFGAYDGPGLLPWAVRTFFAQGGRRAYVCRVSPLPRAPSSEAIAATAVHELLLADASGAVREVRLRAADEGAWGNGLVVTLSFDVDARLVAEGQGVRLSLPSDAAVEAGSLLRVRRADVAPGDGPGQLRWVEAVTTRTDGATRRTVATLDRPGPDGRLEVEVVTATAQVRDTAGDLPRVETFAHLRLTPGHPRWIAQVLAEESLLVDPVEPWPDRVGPLDPLLDHLVSSGVSAGLDRWSGIGRDSFLGDEPPELFPVGGPDPDPHAPLRPGMDAMALVPEVALVTVPDLFWSSAEQAPAVEPPPRRGPAAWEPCRPRDPGFRYAPSPFSSVRLDGHGRHRRDRAAPGQAGGPRRAPAAFRRVARRARAPVAASGRAVALQVRLVVRRGVPPLARGARCGPAGWWPSAPAGAAVGVRRGHHRRA